MRAYIVMRFCIASNLDPVPVAVFAYRDMAEHFLLTQKLSYSEDYRFYITECFAEGFKNGI